MSNSLVVAPSLLAADFTRLAEEVEAVQKAGADWLHIDIMDGHFVPNLSFGPLVVDKFGKGPLPLDVHLMVTNPNDFLEPLQKLGAHSMIVHEEACVHLQRQLHAIRQHGMLAGVALNPSTPPEFLEYLKEDVDLVLVMTVNPGFGGQAFLSSMLPKIRRIREMVGPRPRISADGGVGADNAVELVRAGADVLVAGSSVFGKKDYAAAISALRSAG
ncbi:MAG: ribulose-phosphate 3-epimerase [Candidatus Eremiobacteraeota bacterium]|nr:ribulose-phosphate 3-epimerase [Candidatus Eremiobacteraeota bacterium]MCW5867506.1 ribulose-phosphate 3-epimerase [Candidatus Eremiobacteraeota bacterium]